MTTKTITAQTIKMRDITGFLTSEKNLRDKLQVLIVASVGHAQEHNNDFSLISALIRGLKERKTRNLKAITAYIQEHVTGIHWTKTGQDMGYKTMKGHAVEFKEFTYPWYNHKINMDSQKVQPLDVVKRVKALLTTLDKAIEEGKVHKDQREVAETVGKSLHAILNA